jgi:hypothetical protein
MFRTRPCGISFPHSTCYAHTSTVVIFYSATRQCSGSGSGSRCYFDPWIRDPDPGFRIEKILFDSGSGINATPSTPNTKKTRFCTTLDPETMQERSPLPKAVAREVHMMAREGWRRGRQLCRCHTSDQCCGSALVPIRMRGGWRLDDRRIRIRIRNTAFPSTYQRLWRGRST